MLERIRVCLRVLVSAPSVAVSSNLDLEVHAQDSSGCRCIWLFYNQDAYNQEVFVADVGVQSTRKNDNKNSWHTRATCARQPLGYAPSKSDLDVALTINPIRCVPFFFNPQFYEGGN